MSGNLKQIRVLIVDDSAVVRQTLKQVLESDSKITVVGTAADPYYAVDKIKNDKPDVITLDVEMPKMDGLTFLKKIMSQHPIPVIMVSSLTEKGSETALKALEYGAVDIITKPKLGTKDFITESTIRICDAVKAAASARLDRIKKMHDIVPKLSADVVIAGRTSSAMIQTTEKIVAVGASTGGTEALRIFLQSLPHDSPGIAIVQHMPENFTKAFASRLNDLCKVTVKEAENRDRLLRGHAFIAPGNKHLLIKRSGANYYVEVREGPLVNRHRPSVDVLFRSAARYAGKNAIGIIMTGMGDDGAKGMLEMKNAGARTIAQDESSCVVFGMPKEAIALGAAERIVTLSQIHNNMFAML
ncbi:chemotaxis response regulator protein-glutamate methylesterase [bacterium]|nr:chemotaxis response regulator protein-glutamate methylesterase [bacterium]